MLGATIAFAQETTTPAQSTLSLASANAVFASTITATGRVHATTSARVGPRVSGRLAEFGTSDDQPLDVGMKVKQGQVLFRLDQTTFANHVALAQAQLDSARAALANLTAPTREERIEALKQDVAQLDARVADRTRERDRYKKLVEEEKTLPPRRLEEVETDLAALTAQKRAAQARLLESQRGPTPSEIAVASARVKEAEAAFKIAQDDFRDATVVAPFDGVITRRLKSVGDYLVNMPPTDVVELVNDHRLEAEVCLPESYLPAVRQRPELTLKSPLLRGDLKLPVSRVVDQIDTARGTFVVRIAIPADQKQQLVPGAFVTAELRTPESAGGVIAPMRAVFAEEGKAFVFLSRDGKMIRQPITLGDKLSEGIIVTSGLKEGDRIVIGAAAELADGRDLPEYLK